MFEMRAYEWFRKKIGGKWFFNGIEWTRSPKDDIFLIKDFEDNEAKEPRLKRPKIHKGRYPGKGKINNG